MTDNLAAELSRVFDWLKEQARGAETEILTLKPGSPARAFCTGRANAFREASHHVGHHLPTQIVGSVQAEESSVEVPATWISVPTEPTPEMMAAFCANYLEVAPQATSEMTMRVKTARGKIAYRAMLAAAAPAEARSESSAKPELTADFVRALPGGKWDDSAYEAVEEALDRADAPIQFGGKWLTLAERVAALAEARSESSVEAPRLDREAIIEIVMRETTDDIIADGWDRLGKPNILVQGCKFVRGHGRGYEDPEEAARKFAGFIADALIAAGLAEARSEQAAVPLARGDLWWISEDGESGFTDYGDAYEAAMDYGGYPDHPIQLDRATTLPPVWAARVVLTRDEAGDPDETEVRLFATKAEAEAALALPTPPKAEADHG